ncbi:4-Cys prefix domain-containing protein [Fischerella sp. PCC 9605]|uniref:4-Cys prefix domain-containing protein n=1 Tax=Fischerella sp. PCC 9605 TaxID=1173024 RepID=UPI0012DE295E|nr:4-Cys prefix domain-containing protein [Fischerella sp. PCC 9605]
MSYCLNPHCPNPSDPMNIYGKVCRNCGTNLLLKNRYRVIQLLGRGGFAKTFEIDDAGKTKVLKVLDLSRF